MHTVIYSLQYYCENRPKVQVWTVIHLDWDLIHGKHLIRSDYEWKKQSVVSVFLPGYVFVITGTDALSFRFLCLLRFLFSPSSVFFSGGVGMPFFFLFFRQLKGLGLFCFLFLFFPRLSPSLWLIPCSSFRLRMLCCWAGLTSSPSWTAWTWSRDVWQGLSRTMVLRMM